MPYKDPEAMRLYQKTKGRWRKLRRKEDGLCLNCPRRAFPGRTLCRVCLFKAANRKKRRRLLKCERGLCVYDGCGEAALPGWSMCATHRERSRSYMAKYNLARRGASEVRRCGKKESASTTTARSTSAARPG